MKTFGVIAFSTLALALVGAIVFFAVQGFNEAERVAEQKTTTAQQQAEINKREAADQQKKTTLDQALKDCVAKADQQYAANIKEAQQTAEFPSQEAADKYVKQLQDVRNAQVDSCKQQYNQAMQQTGLEVVP